MRFNSPALLASVLFCRLSTVAQAHQTASAGVVVPPPPLVVPAPAATPIVVDAPPEVPPAELPPPDLRVHPIPPEIGPFWHIDTSAEQLVRSGRTMKVGGAILMGAGGLVAALGLGLQTLHIAPQLARPSRGGLDFDANFALTAGSGFTMMGVGALLYIVGVDKIERGWKLGAVTIKPPAISGGPGGATAGLTGTF